MIYTITFNPSLDYIMQVNHLNEGKTNRSTSEVIYPGGKGFNVSMILNNLDVDNMALGFIAGFTGQHILECLNQKNVKTNLIELDSGMSRINVKVKGQNETEINGNGPYIDSIALEKLYAKLDNLNKDDILVLAGSIPSSLPKNMYSIILERLTSKSIKSVVDASGDLLLNVLEYRPFLIKPNKDELEEIFHCKIRNKDHLIQLMHILQEKGAKNVLVSLGKDGACLLDEHQEFYYQKAFEGKLVNSVGSGDSMIAGFIAGHIKGFDYKECLKLGSACGSATAFSLDLATKDEIQTIFGKEIR